MNIPDVNISKLARDTITPKNPRQLNELLKKFVTDEYFTVDKKLDRPLACSYIEGKILFNPAHALWKTYDVAEAVTHEITHLIDFDLVAALTDNIFHGNYYHSAKYWSEIGNTEREVVANLMTIHFTEDNYRMNCSVEDFIRGG